MQDISFTDRVPDQPAWARLTVSADKVREFSLDAYFREAWADVVEIAAERLDEVLAQLALFSFKPDAIPSGRMLEGLHYLRENGFRPLSAVPMRQNRHSMRELWRYNWHVYPADRLAMCTLLHTAAPTLVLLLRDERYDGMVPGAVRLAALKGPAEPSQQRPGQLRTILAPPNAVINFVHVADEPADVVRELGIFFDRKQRRDLVRTVLEAWDEDASGSAREAIGHLEATYPRNDYKFPAALARLQARGALDSAGVEAIRHSAVSGPPLTWEQLLGLLNGASDDPASVWDFLLVASTVLPTERVGGPGPDLLPASTAQDWMRPSPAPAARG